jgi:uncharacterized protein
MATVLITGGTGLVGKALGQALVEKGYSIIILTRDKQSKESNSKTAKSLRYAEWNIEKKYIDSEAISQADYIIHLAGAGVADKRWSKKRKQEIIDSRVNSSQLIVDSLKTIPNKVKAVVSASAIGWYGPDPLMSNLPAGQAGPKPFSENDPADDAFLGTTCKLWEESIEPVTQLGKRLVKLRTGIVLSKDGGALAEFKKPLKFGVAAILGNGKQVISWIHIDDLVQLYIAAIENEAINGSYNAVAPNPVSNKELTLQLARIKNGKLFIPIHVPPFVLRIVLGEMSIEVLKSATVSAEKILQTGFHYKYPFVNEALKACI